MTPHEISALFPEVVLRCLPSSKLLEGLLAAMAGLQSPSEEAHDRLAEWLDPSRAPARALPVACGLLGLDPRLAMNERTLRHLVTEAPALQKTRGRADCLTRMLEVCLGTRGFAVIPAPARPFHVQVRAPAALRIERDRIEAIIRACKPAHVSHELIWDDPGGKP
jgi:hypothetical protein